MDIAANVIFLQCSRHQQAVFDSNRIIPGMGKEHGWRLLVDDHRIVQSQVVLLDQPRRVNQNGEIGSARDFIGGVDGLILSISM